MSKRSVLTSFLEASAARGAWQSALAAWCSAVAGGVAVPGPQALLLTRVLAQAGRWREAAHVATSDKTPLCPQRLAAGRVAMVAAAEAACWETACRLLQSAQRCVDGNNGGGEKKGKLNAEWLTFLSSFEHHVVPRIPELQRGPWTTVVRDMCSGDAVSVHSLDVDAWRQRHAVRADIAVTNNEDLLHIDRSPKTRSSWARALQLLFSMPHPNAASVGITIRVLSRQGREQEALDVITKFATSRGIHPTTVMVKTVLEAANTMRSLELCKVVLRTPLLRDQLTPAAAVPLVLVLQRVGEWEQCLAWWNSLQPTAASSSSNRHDDDHSGAAKLRGHLKLSSYVAVCVARGGRWVEALRALETASLHDPPLAVLFALRALRVAGEWRTAVGLFLDKKHIWEHSPVSLQVKEVVMGQNAESWVPLATLRALCASCRV